VPGSRSATGPRGAPPGTQLRVENLTTGTVGTAGAFSGFAAFDSTLAIGANYSGTSAAIAKIGLHLPLGLSRRLPVKALTLSLLLLSAPAWGGEPFTKDRGWHLGMGLGIGSMSYAATAAWVPGANPVVVSLSLTTTAALGKEGFDALVMGHRFDLWDAAFTVLGGVISVGLSLAVSAVFAGPGR
jgi:hypothetical protein